MIECMFGETTKLRKPQRAAAIAAYSHFMTNSEPAILCLPTGSGKTVLIALLHLVLSSRRTIVVEPTTALRQQSKDRLDGLSELSSYMSIPPEVTQKVIKCIELKREMDSEEKWLEIEECDICVCTPHVASSKLKRVVAPPTDLEIDLVIIDEAHHSAAITWSCVQIPMARISRFRSSSRHSLGANPA